MCSESITYEASSSESKLILYVLFQVAAFMRSRDSSASHPLKVREMTTMKGVGVLTVFWATAEEAMNKGEVGVPQCPQTLEGPIPTNEYSG